MNVSSPKSQGILANPERSLRIICMRRLWFLALWLAPVSSVAVDPALGPIIYELANQERFEVLWFHPSLNHRVVGDIARARPLRYGIPRQTNDRAIVSSYLPGAGPIAIWRVSIQINPDDPFPDLPGDQFTLLDVSIGASRNDLIIDRLSFQIGRNLSDGREPLVTAYPAAILANADSLFVGLRWRSGSSTNPQVGLQDNLGQILLQEIGYETSSGMNWTISPDNYSLEVAILDWRPADLRQILPTVGIRGFEVWYASDSLAGSAGAFSSAMLFSDSLIWQSNLVQDGYVSLVVIDTQGTVSARKQLRLNISDFGHLSFSSSSLEFDWQDLESRSQILKIRNLGTLPVTLNLYSEDNMLVVNPATILMAGSAENSIRLSLRQAPGAGTQERFALYIHNNQGWLPVKLEARALPIIQTSVGEDDIDNKALPRSFSVSEVYPNPSRGNAKITLTSSVSQSFTIEVYNVLGQVLQTSEIHVLGQREIPVEIESSSDLPIAAGIYFVRVSTGSESLMRKFVLIK